MLACSPVSGKVGIPVNVENSEKNSPWVDEVLCDLLEA
jgi:hypothetical protein